MSEIKPFNKTMTELTLNRKGVEKKDIARKKNERDSKVAHLQKVQFKDYYQPDSYIKEPKYTATWQKARDDRFEKRISSGLEFDNVDINPEKLPDPSLKYVDKTNVDFETRRKAAMLSELKKMEKNFDTHINGQERIENRENCILRLTFKGLETESKNLRSIKEKRVKEMIDDMTNKFGDQVLGVHGQELPKFADNEKD